MRAAQERQKRAVAASVSKAAQFIVNIPLFKRWQPEKMLEAILLFVELYNSYHIRNHGYQLTEPNHTRVL